MYNQLHNLYQRCKTKMLLRIQVSVLQDPYCAKMAFSFTFISFCNNNTNDMVDTVTFAPFAPLSSSAVCKNMQRVNRPSLMSQRTQTSNSFTQHYTLVCSYLLLLGLLKQKTVTGALQLYQTTSLLAAEREKRRG